MLWLSNLLDLNLTKHHWETLEHCVTPCSPPPSLVEENYFGRNLNSFRDMRYQIAVAVCGDSTPYYHTLCWVFNSFVVLLSLISLPNFRNALIEHPPWTYSLALGTI